MKIILSSEDQKDCIRMVCKIHRDMLIGDVSHMDIRKKFKENCLHNSYLDCVVIRIWNVTQLKLLHPGNKLISNYKLETMVKSALYKHLDIYGHKDV